MTDIWGVGEVVAAKATAAYGYLPIRYSLLTMSEVRAYLL